MSHYSVHNRLLLILLLSHMSPDHAMACQSSFFKIHANFILLLIRDSDPKKGLLFQLERMSKSQRKRETIIFF